MDAYRRYRGWVRRNGSILALAETGLSTLTWLLPDRFNDNELSLEAIHTSINLISALHDTMLNEPKPEAPIGASELTFALNALQQVQVLVELWGLYSEKNGAIDSHYDPLIAVEGLKSIVRLSILRTSGCRILSNGGATTFDPVMMGSATAVGGLGGGSLGGSSKEPGSEAKAREVFTAFAAFRDKHCFVPPRKIQRQNQRALSTKAENGCEDKNKIQPPLWWEDDEEEQNDMKSPAAGSFPPTASSLDQTQSQQQEGEWSQPPASGPPNSMQALKSLEYQTSLRQAAAYKLIILGELLHILRPVLYVAALRRWGRRSWKPWTLSLALELGSNRLTAAGAVASHRAAAEAARSPAVAGTALAALYGMQGIQWRREELDEITRRKLQLMLGLLRDPFFSRVTGPAVEQWGKRLDRVPLIGRISNKVVELLLGIQKYYTYTSGS
ncbi:hypothetical protein Ndes2526B_g00686 [Nannochloris sp. 'desiccata']|nr:putative Peroxisome biogenesis protein 16 [Chlorella desiccata (nom. nud.)]